MDNQILMQTFAESTIHILIFGVLIGALFAIATLAIFDAIKLMRANCSAKCATSCSTEMAKPAVKAAAKAAVKPVAKKAAPKKKK